MTNKEAMEIMKGYREKLTNSCANNLFDDIEAFNIAIEALDNIDELCENLAFYINERNRLLDKRPTGEWLHNSDRPDNLICSVCNCGWDMWRYESKELNYCPNCGAKMKGEEK